MGRGATKAVGNRWYQARITASKYNERLSSREGAAEALHMSVDAVTDAELGLSKTMPVDKAVLMSDLYGDPSLLNYYCLHECPIGRNLPISDETPSIEQATLALLSYAKFDRISNCIDRLVDIAEDGKITDDEAESLEDIVYFLEKLSKNTSKLRNILELRKYPRE